MLIHGFIEHLFHTRTAIATCSCCLYMFQCSPQKIKEYIQGFAYNCSCACYSLSCPQYPMPHLVHVYIFFHQLFKYTQGQKKKQTQRKRKKKGIYIYIYIYIYIHTHTYIKKIHIHFPTDYRTTHTYVY